MLFILSTNSIKVEIIRSLKYFYQLLYKPTFVLKNPFTPFWNVCSDVEMFFKLFLTTKFLNFEITEFK